MLGASLSFPSSPRGPGCSRFLPFGPALKAGDDFLASRSLELNALFHGPAFSANAAFILPAVRAPTG